MTYTVKERIRRFIKSKRMSVKAFETSIGAGNAYISSIRKGIGIDKLNVIKRKYPELNISWLLTGEGSMLISEQAIDVVEDVNSVKERLRRFIKYKGLRLQDFMQTIGRARNYFSTTGNISSDVLREIGVKYPELNMQWVLLGEGSMLREDTITPTISYTSGVPYYDVDFRLGFDALVPPTSESPEYLIQMPGYDKATLWCNASGDSMKPEINNGDIIALQKIDDLRFILYGEIYAIITTNGMRTIKRIGKSSHDGFYRLIPTNPEYDEQDIPSDMLLHVYRVLGCMKRF